MTRRCRVLIVDDEDDLRDLLKVALELDGLDVETAANGAVALERLRQEHFDAVVTDLFMPNVDGIELMRDVKVAQPQIKVVAISGWGLTRSKTDYLGVARELGADHVLVKPFDPRTLSGILSNLCMSKMGPGAAGGDAA
jgi:CheY-like chemotaxis protein